MMDLETVRAATDWIASLNDNPVTVTFHGGEPLLAGSEFYEAALPMIEEGLGPRSVAFAMQSNLWLLDDRLAAVLAAHNVPIGTSLDGPPELNDAQRGTGYFEKTQAGMEVAARHGVRVSVICTFTAELGQGAGSHRPVLPRERLRDETPPGASRRSATAGPTRTRLHPRSTASSWSICSTSTSPTSGGSAS